MKTGNTVEIDKDKLDQTIQLHVGDQLAVNLAETPTTGFRWAVDAVDPAMLSLDNSDIELSSSKMAGSAGTRRLVFVVQKAGTTRLALKLWREWEGDKSITDRFAVSVNVTD